MDRPKEVRTSVFLLSLSLMIGIGRSLLVVFRGQASEVSPSAQGLGLIAVATLGILLVYQISLGRNWARLVFTAMVVLACAGLPYTLQGMREGKGLNATSSALGLAQVLIQVAGMGLLYRPSSRAFFQSIHSSKT